MSDKTIAPQIYGADEVNAVVLDPGSYTTQAGFAGFDQPSIVMPSYYGNYKNENNETVKIFDENVLFSNAREGLEINPIISNNLVIDWDGAMDQFKYISEKLEINPSEQPLLLTESTMNSYENKVKAMQYFFEEQNFCAFYAVKQPTCVSFAHGRPNCLVVDVGHDLLTVTPVIDGLCLRNQVRGTTYAGAFLNQQLRQFLNNKSITYNPPFEIKNKQGIFWEDKETLPKFEFINKDRKANRSVIDFSYLRTLREMKELLFECCMDDEIIIPEDLTKEYENDDTRWFELPNGLNIPFTLYERQKLSNSLFNPNNTLSDVVEGWEIPHDGNIIKTIGTKNDITSKDYIPLRRSKKNDEDDTNATTPTPEIAEENNLNDNKIVPSANKESSDDSIGIINLIQNVLNNLDIDLKPQLANNIILTGSTTLIPKLNERLNNELVLMNPSLKVRVHSAGNTTERKHASWIGGSILSSLGTFHQLWVSKAEYEEVGPEQLIVNRFR